MTTSLEQLSFTELIIRRDNLEKQLFRVNNEIKNRVIEESKIDVSIQVEDNNSKIVYPEKNIIIKKKRIIKNKLIPEQNLENSVISEQNDENKLISEQNDEKDVMLSPNIENNIISEKDVMVEQNTINNNDIITENNNAIITENNNDIITENNSKPKIKIKLRIVKK